MELSPEEMAIFKKVIGNMKGSIRGALGKKMMPQDEGSPEEEAAESPDVEAAEPDGVDGAPDDANTISDDDMEELRRLLGK